MHRNNHYFPIKQGELKTISIWERIRAISL
jgi:hypothetical protein